MENFIFCAVLFINFKNENNSKLWSYAFRILVQLGRNNELRKSSTFSLNFNLSFIIIINKILVLGGELWTKL